MCLLPRPCRGCYAELATHAFAYQCLGRLLIVSQRSHATGTEGILHSCLLTLTPPGRRHRLAPTPCRPSCSTPTTPSGASPSSAKAGPTCTTPPPPVHDWLTTTHRCGGCCVTTDHVCIRVMHPNSCNSIPTHRYELQWVLMVRGAGRAAWGHSRSATKGHVSQRAFMRFFRTLRPKGVVSALLQCIQCPVIDLDRCS